MSALKYWLWLSTAKVSAKAKALMLERYGDAEAAFLAKDGEYKDIKGITSAEASVLEGRDTSACDKIISDCAAQNIRIITYQDAEYPARLKNIYMPPPVLFVKGKFMNVDENAVVSVIGTRKASPYGIKMSRDISYGIAKCGGVVLSLLGSDVDRAAYKAALMAGGNCLAVIPYAHEQCSERSMADICAGGAVISEYAPGTKTLKSFFRERNRLAAGLSVAVVVVEAPANSGTKLFAEEAAEQGKEIFAVPGNADSENSAGTLAMIKDGARLVTDGRELMSEFAELYPEKIKLKTVENIPEIPKDKDITQLPKPVKKDVDNKKHRGYIDLKDQLASLSEEQLKIVTAIDSDLTHIDDIIEATGMSASKVLSNITLLAIKGFIRRESGNRISLNIAKK